MSLRIAVAVNETGTTTSLYEPGCIVVYEKKQETWNIVEKIPYDLQQVESIQQMRANIVPLVRRLRGVSQVFVGLTVNALPHFELEQAGFSIWEFDGNPVEFLDYIQEQEELPPEPEKVNLTVVPVPKEVRPGEFFISIKDFQGNQSGPNSKQILQPFLRSGVYNVLEVHCSHIPPWLQMELMQDDFSWKQEILGAMDVKLIIQKKIPAEKNSQDRQE